MKSLTHFTDTFQLVTDVVIYKFCTDRLECQYRQTGFSQLQMLQYRQWLCPFLICLKLDSYLQHFNYKTHQFAIMKEFYEVHYLK